MYTRAAFYATEPSNAAVYAPVEGGLPRHESAHCQEGDGGGGLTERGLPRHESAHGQDGGNSGVLTEGGLTIELATSEPADRQRQAISDAERREQRRAARDERERAAHATVERHRRRSRRH